MVRRGNEKARPSGLEKLAAEAEAIVLELPEDEQEKALDGLKHIVEAGRCISTLPEALMGRLWRILVLIVGKTTLGAKGSHLLKQVARGCPQLDSRFGITAAIAEVEAQEEREAAAAAAAARAT